MVIDTSHFMIYHINRSLFLLLQGDRMNNDICWEFVLAQLAELKKLQEGNRIFQTPASFKLQRCAPTVTPIAFAYIRSIGTHMSVMFPGQHAKPGTINRFLEEIEHLLGKHLPQEPADFVGEYGGECWDR